MKKLLAVAIVLMIAVMAMTACASEHESEIAKEQRQQQEALDQYLAGEVDDANAVDEKVPDANAEPAEVVVIYYVSEGAKGLEKAMDDVPEIDDWELTEKLKAYKVLPETAQVVDIEPDKGILEYDGVESLTPRQAQAIINTFVENMGMQGQIKLLILGEEVLTSGYNADYENIDDTYTGGAADTTGAEGGPGVQ